MSLQSIREALTRHGQLSAAQLGERIDLGPSSISSQLKTLRDKREIYICEWVLFKGFGPGRNRPIYAVGDFPDAVSPTRGRRAKAKEEKLMKAATPAQVKSSMYAEARQQAGMWGGLMA